MDPISKKPAKREGFSDFVIDIFLEVQKHTYSSIFYLIEYIAYGVHLCIKIVSFCIHCKTYQSEGFPERDI